MNDFGNSWKNVIIFSAHLFTAAFPNVRVIVEEINKESSFLLRIITQKKLTGSLFNLVEIVLRILLLQIDFL